MNLPVSARWLLFPLLFCCVVAHANQTGETHLTGLISSLNTQPNNLNTQQQQLIYEESLALLKEGDDYRNKAKEYRNIINNFASLRSEIQQQLNQFEDPTLDWNALNSKQLTEQLGEWQTKLNNSSSEIDELKQRQYRIDLDVSENHQRSGPLRQQLTTLRANLEKQQFGVLNEVEEAQRVRNQVSEASLTAQLAMLDLAAQSANYRNELLQLKISLLQREQLAEKRIVEQLKGALSIEHRAETKRLSDQLAFEAPELLEQPLVKNLVQNNRQLQTQLSALFEQSEDIALQQQLVNEELEYVKLTFANFKEQVSWLKVTRSYGEYLREQIATLPKAKTLAPVEQQIIEVRISKHREQNEIYNFRSAANQRAQQDLFASLSESQSKIVNKHLKLNQQLSAKYLLELDARLFELARLKLDYSRLNDQLKTINQEANQELFWTADVKAIDLSFFSELSQSLAWLFKAQHLTQLKQALQSTSWLWLVWLAMVAASIGYVRYLKKHWLKGYLQRIDAKTGNITRDRFSYTLSNLLLSAAFATPIALFIASLGFGLMYQWEFAYVRDVGDALIKVAMGLWLFHLLQQFCQKNGLLNTHFKWPLINIQQAITLIRKLVYISLPLLFVLNLCILQTSQPAYSSLARLTFISILVWAAYGFHRIYRMELPVNYHLDIFKAPQLARKLIWGAAISIPLIAAFASAAGFFATAFTVYWQVMWSFIIAAIFLLIYLLSHRWMLLQRRRIAFDRAKVRRAEMIAQRHAEDEDGTSSNEGFVDAIEEPVIDLDTISAQSLGLLRAALILALVSVLLFSWSEMTSAFSFLDNVTLWESNTSRAGVAMVDAITLRSVGSALLVFFFTMLLIRNLPGLLELMVLQHLSLSPGTGFAITTMINYMVILFGIFSGFGLLGIEWSKLQWLIAALTVGLGFGLQEIFANFISGLIILFEKPIRIGDTVTIRELTGTISNIETRATTIVDWDRKEIIVPNKAFITEQFINWSLTDPITRVVLMVQVKQGSNNQLVTELLQESVEANSLVLTNPTPEIYFTGYTDNGLKYEMRVYVSEMRYRLPMTHELYTLINDKFKANNIVVAYPQLDVSLNS
ncbi:miniconductance mechanosensitive channel MscM [Agarivorans sp. MS3-6]|uniref:miniconductance mechanosensitive channel MscM n=1 Tax=Agarivorans sp. TSD2052 TaxID=2937286 RepID=UPI00200BA482|nr:miniconductance mechanosensitive channel MscM [Agarivorans sp. TSD2052]UPW18056.1 miniconductance mechanosensitive channel MscM [Agarivorans sp. TSD2052]